MFSRFRGKLSGVVIGLLIGAVAIVGAVAVPATAQPVASASQSIAQQVRQALGFSKKAARSANVANRRAIGAIRLARSAEGTPGPRGPAGPRGPQGPAGEDGEDGQDGQDGQDGADGATGPAGEDGTFGGDLPSGETLRGPFSIHGGRTGNNPNVQTDIAFPAPLPINVQSSNVHAIDPQGTPPPECDDGSAPAPSPSNPEADPGHLCLFAQFLLGASFADGSPDVTQDPTSGASGASKYGALVNFTASGDDAIAFGTWAVTAP